MLISQMKVNRVKIIVLVSVLVILFVSLAIFHYFVSIRERKRHHHPLIAIYPTAVPGHDPVSNTEQFLSDLALIKDLGFEGVRLHPKDYEIYGYGRVADDLNNLGLKFVMVVQCWNFTDEASFNQTIAYFQNIAQQLKNKSNLLWYAVDYPYDWQRPYTQMEDPNYGIKLQRIIDAVHETDPYHEIYLISGMIDVVATPPMDFDYVDGFGIMPYSREGLMDKIDTERIRWIDKYRATGKEVYIAEWGVQTIENSPNRTYHYGLATNEAMKVKMIEEFIDYIYDWDIYWTYFGLHDFPLENSDWGIVYYNNTLKPSGEAIKRALTNRE